MSLLLLLLSLPAEAGSVRALVEVGPAGPVVVEVSETTASPRRVMPGDLQVVSADGTVLATAAIPDPRLKSVITREGGQAVMLERNRIPVTLPWPDGAHAVQLKGLRTRPTPPTSPLQRSAPTGPTATLVQEAGSPESRLDLVILGDGYQQAELGKFADDVDRIVTYLLGIQPYGDYADLFNIWRVDVVSTDSGADHPEVGPSEVALTALDCGYGCAGIDRLICCDDSEVLRIVDDLVPAAEGVLVLVNDDTYGGSGGFAVAVSYANGADSTQVAAHELGHSLVGLWDEYGYGTPGGNEVGPNCAPSTDVHWPEWVGTGEVDAFQECSYTTHYRPTENSCMMRTLSDDYCPVCRQEVVLAMYGKVPGLVESTEPPVGELVTDGVVSATTVLAASQLELSWTLDGNEVGTGPTVELPCDVSGELTLQVTDPTNFVRADPEGLLQDTAGPWTVEPGPDCVDSPDGDPFEELDCSGCDTGSGSAPGWVLLPLLWGLRRRQS